MIFIRLNVHCLNQLKCSQKQILHELSYTIQDQNLEKGINRKRKSKQEKQPSTIKKIKSDLPDLYNVIQIQQLQNHTDLSKLYDGTIDLKSDEELSIDDELFCNEQLSEDIQKLSEKSKNTQKSQDKANVTHQQLNQSIERPPCLKQSISVKQNAQSDDSKVMQLPCMISDKQLKLIKKDAKQQGTQTEKAARDIKGQICRLIKIYTDDKLNESYNIFNQAEEVIFFRCLYKLPKNLNIPNYLIFTDCALVKRRYAHFSTILLHLFKDWNNIMQQNNTKFALSVFFMKVKTKERIDQLITFCKQNIEYILDKNQLPKMKISQDNIIEYMENIKYKLLICVNNLCMCLRARLGNQTNGIIIENKKKSIKVIEFLKQIANFSQTIFTNLEKELLCCAISYDTKKNYQYKFCIKIFNLYKEKMQIKKLTFISLLLCFIDLANGNLNNMYCLEFCQLIQLNTEIISVPDDSLITCKHIGKNKHIITNWTSFKLKFYQILNDIFHNNLIGNLLSKTRVVQSFIAILQNSSIENNNLMISQELLNITQKNILAKITDCFNNVEKYFASIKNDTLQCVQLNKFNKDPQAQHIAYLNHHSLLRHRRKGLKSLLEVTTSDVLTQKEKHIMKLYFIASYHSKMYFYDSNNLLISVLFYIIDKKNINPCKYPGQLTFQNTISQIDNPQSFIDDLKNDINYIFSVKLYKNQAINNGSLLTANNLSELITEQDVKSLRDKLLNYIDEIILNAIIASKQQAEETKKIKILKRKIKYQQKKNQKMLIVNPINEELHSNSNNNIYQEESGEVFTEASGDISIKESNSDNCSNNDIEIDILDIEDGQSSNQDSVSNQDSASLINHSQLIQEDSLSNKSDANISDKNKACTLLNSQKKSTINRQDQQQRTKKYQSHKTDDTFVSNLVLEEQLFV